MQRKPEVVKDGRGARPWRARVNPGSGRFTVAREFPTWREAFDWLDDELFCRWYAGRPVVIGADDDDY